MTWLIFTAAILATHRLALLLTKEDGPAWIFRKIRKLPPPRSNARKGLECIWCAVVWFSAVVTTFLWWQDLFPGIWWPLWWLAISSGAIVINQQWTKG